MMKRVRLSIQLLEGLVHSVMGWTTYSNEIITSGILMQDL